MSSELSRLGTAAAVLLCLLPSGCGGAGDTGPRASVAGTVLLDGVPLSAGIIRFIPLNSPYGSAAMTSAMVRDGLFGAEGDNGPLVGENRVEIESTDDGGFALDDEAALEQLKAAGRTRVDVVVVPERYNRRSELTRTITADGSNHFLFELKSQQP